MHSAAAGTALFFVLAPGSTAGLVPWLITGWSVPAGHPGWAVVAGSIVALSGLLLVLACFTRFVREGRGTPAPVAPTEDLVVGGMYRFIRNPMYVGVGAMIGGQALAFGSAWTALWLGVFLTSVWSFVHWYEEPTLQRQFGESYDAYRRSVPGWWPRLTSWQG